jgi:hypothetical protein
MLPENYALFNGLLSKMTGAQFNVIFAGSLDHERAAAQGARITGDGRAFGTLFDAFDRSDEQPVLHTALC